MSHPTEGRPGSTSIDDAAGRWAWQQWHATLDLPSGCREITARAWDDAGESQPKSPATVWNPMGYGNNSWHRVRVDVG